MSSEILPPLEQEALSRMSPYQLVERAVGLTSLVQNTLDIPPIELENGTTLHTVTSNLQAGCHLRTELILQDDWLVRRHVMDSPEATLTANVVALTSPNDNQPEGDAQLYRLNEPFILPLDKARRPFRKTALDVMTSEDVVARGVRLDQTNTAYYRFLNYASEAEYLKIVENDGPVLLATEKSDVEVKVVGKDELDKEVGALAAIYGAAKILLKPKQFMRITDSGVFYGPGMAMTADVNVPSDISQYQIQDAKYYRIPDNATVEPNANGRLVPVGERAKERKYEQTFLNPCVSAADALNLIGPENIRWIDATDTFLKTLGHLINPLMRLDAEANYLRICRQVEHKIRQTILAGRPKPRVGESGCLAVAACVSQLSPIPPGAHQVDASFFA